MGYIGQTPSAVPLTSADIADGTITNDDLAGSIADAKISALSASKLTGSLPASMATDLAPVRSDILKLAIHQGIDGNRTAFNLEDSFIDTFEDDTGITTETTVDRNTTGEYVNTSVPGSAVYETGDRRSTITVTDDTPGQAGGLFNDGDGAPERMVDGVSNTSGSTNAISWHGTAAAGRYCRFQFSTAKTVTEAKWYQDASATHGVWKWQGSNDGTTFTDIGNSFTLGGTLQTQTELNGNTTAYTYYQLLGISGSASGASYQREVEFKVIPLVVGATGTLISDPQTASTSRTSCSGVIIYSDAAGTNTLGTHLKIYFSCDNGSNWTESSSYGTPQIYSGTKKLVKLGATTCTAGNQILIKAVWAGQSASLEARLEGWAVNY
jgi:hypothetical protein